MLDDEFRTAATQTDPILSASDDEELEDEEQVKLT